VVSVEHDDDLTAADSKAAFSAPDLPPPAFGGRWMQRSTGWRRTSSSRIEPVASSEPSSMMMISWRSSG